MNITFITDEATQSPEEFIRLAGEYNIKSVELRSVWNKKVCEMDASDIKELKKILNDAGLGVCCIDSFVFKSEIGCDIQPEIDKLRLAIENALYLGAPVIRIFTYLRRANPEIYRESILESLLKAGKVAENSGIKLAVENCRKTMVATGAELAEIFQKLESDVFSVLWDPANSLFCRLDPDPVNNGYFKIAHRVSHVHIKDPFVPENGDSEYVAVGRGNLDIKGQLRELNKRQYKGYISLETHWRPNRKMNLEEFDLPGGESFSKSGYEATKKDLETLFAIMKDVVK
jgi:sugar phosphate isomerase/epimerase